MAEAGNDDSSVVRDAYAIKAKRYQYGFVASEHDRREVFALALYRDDLDEFLEHIDDFVNLVKLGLSGIESLDLGVIGRLPQLVYLDASGNSLESVGSEICELANLRFLDLSKNHLETLPEALLSRGSLFELNVSDNHFQRMPEALARCSELRVMRAADNQIDELDAGMKAWERLERLNLSGNRLSGFDLWDASWSSLESLVLDKNQIEEIGDGGDAFHARAISLADNGLGSLPGWLCTVPGLESLNVARNNLSALPLELTRSDSLRELIASGNSIESFPRGGVKNLEILRLSGCNLSEVPRFVCTSTNLKLLSLANNRLDSLPEELGSLDQLTELYVQGNNLNHLPKVCGSLCRLVKLDACDNRLAGFPDALGAIESLRQLSAGNNRIARLPDSFASLQLTRLDLSGNKLESLPDVLQNFTELTELNLARNTLTHVPDELQSLSSLQTLILDGNRIEELPPWLAEAERLTQLTVADNPLLNLPADLAGDAPGAIEFLKHVAPGYVPQLKMKLVAVGSTGSSTGFAELVVGRYAADKEHVSVELDSGLTLQLSIWQIPILNGSTRERFVLTPSTPYVILLANMHAMASRGTEADEDALAGMLDRISEVSNDSPMLLVLPRRPDNSVYEELIGTLSGRYNFDFLELNLSEPDDVDRLLRWVKDRLRSDPLLAECAGRMIPLTWRRAEMALDRIRDKTRCLDGPDFSRLCVDAGLTQPELIAFADHLVATGQIARNASTSFVTIDPRWLDGLLTKLDHWNEPESCGRINRESARELVSEAAVAAFSGMEVCFREQGETTVLVAPQHLPPGPPEPRTFELLRAVARLPSVRYQFRRLERHHSVQLIAALGAGGAHGQYWSDGLLVSDATAVAAVELLRERSEVEVRVLSVATETRVLATIHDVIERVGRSLNVVGEIPCPCKACRDADGPIWYSLSSLWEAGRTETLTCPASGMAVDIAPVIRTFWPDAMEESVDFPEETNVFISFNEHDHDVAEKVRSALADYDVKAILFHNELRPGETIEDSIRRYIDASATTLLIVSTHSLQSQWVGQEVLESLSRMRSEGRRFIACYLDDEYLTNDAFVRQTRQKLSAQIQTLTHEISRLTDTGTPSFNLQRKLKRLHDLHHNMDDIVSHLKEITGLCLRDHSFEASMQRVAAEVVGKPVSAQSQEHP